jgi:hypothetical protein
MAVEFELAYPGGLRIHRGLSEVALLAFEASHHLTRRDVGTGWVWYGLPDIRAGRFSLAIEVSVFGGQVRSLHLVPIYEGEAPEDFWDAWSESREQSRAEDVAEWFRSRGHEPGKYSWGEVWAGFDPRSGFASGVVNFTD